MPAAASGSRSQQPRKSRAEPRAACEEDSVCRGMFSPARVTASSAPSAEHMPANRERDVAASRSSCGGGIAIWNGFGDCGAGSA